MIICLILYFFHRFFNSLLLNPFISFSKIPIIPINAQANGPLPRFLLLVN